MKEKTKTGQSVHFTQRIVEALDMDIADVPAKLGISFTELQDMWTGSRLQIAAVDQDEAWVRVAEYVDKRIGLLMSVREELQRKLSAERKARLAHRLRIQNR